MAYLQSSIRVDMEPINFYVIVLPLAVLIVILVSLVLYLARKEENRPNEELKRLRMQLRSGIIDEKTFERMINRRKQERIYFEELERLQTPLRDKNIDQNTYVRLRKLLEIAFTKRLAEFNA